MSGDPGYPDDIRQYDNDPRSPFYEEKYSDEQYQEYQEQEIVSRLDEAHYGADWIEDIVWTDKGHREFLSLVAKIRSLKPISQEEINKSFAYFLAIADSAHQKWVENEDLGEELINKLDDESDSARYGI